MTSATLLHASLIISDLERSRRFYEDLLGLTPSPNRPELGFPGIWYDLGNAQIHLLCVTNPDPVDNRPAHGGRDRHTALAVPDWDVLKQGLDRAGIGYTLSKSGRKALFCRDPDGNTLELLPLGG